MNTIKSISNKVITTVLTLGIATSIQANPLSFDGLEYGAGGESHGMQYAAGTGGGEGNFSNSIPNNLNMIDKEELVNSMDWITSFTVMEMDNNENSMTHQASDKVKGGFSKKQILANIVNNEIDKGEVDKYEEIQMGDKPNNCVEVEEGTRIYKPSVKDVLEEFMKPTQGNSIKNCGKLLVAHLGGMEALPAKAEDAGYGESFQEATDSEDSYFAGLDYTNENQSNSVSEMDFDDESENTLATTARDLAKAAQDYVKTFRLGLQATTERIWDRFFSEEECFESDDAEAIRAKKIIAAKTSSYSGVHVIKDKEYIITIIMKKKEFLRYSQEETDEKKEEAIKDAFDKIVEKVNESDEDTNS